MAQRQRRKRSLVRRLLVYIFVPLSVWLIAFVIWFYWYDFRGYSVKDKEPKNFPKAARELDKSEKLERGTKRPPEKLFDEERKKLEDIIKRES
jgi:hypothetical protein